MARPTRPGTAHQRIRAAERSARRYAAASNVVGVAGVAAIVLAVVHLAGLWWGVAAGGVALVGMAYSLYLSAADALDITRRTGQLNEPRKAA